MDDPTRPAPRPGTDPSATERRRLLREVLIAAAAATAICSLLSWLQEYVPLLRANLYVLVAALFLYLPVFLLRRRGLTTWDVGLTSRPRLRNLLLALAAMAVIFPPYALGFHHWQALMFGNSPHFEADAYRRWPAEWDGRPGLQTSPDGLALFVEGRRIHLRWSGQGADPLQVRLKSDGGLSLLSGRGVRLQQPAGSQDEHLLRFPARRAAEVRLQLAGGEYLELSASQGGQELPTRRVFLGAGSEHPGEMPLRAERSLVWLLLLALSHLLLVALPEELFYRGYVQTTLDRVWPRRLRLLGAEVGASLLVASVIFALGHFLVDFRVQRLAVFFPSLLFGWLRARSDSLAAPILVHAASNVFSDLLTKGYGS